MATRIGSQPTQQTAVAAPTTAAAAPAPAPKPMDTAMASLDSNISNLSKQFGSAGTAGSDAFASSPNTQSFLDRASGGVPASTSGSGSLSSLANVGPRPPSTTAGTSPTSKFLDAVQGDAGTGGGKGGGRTGGVGSDFAMATSGGFDTPLLNQSTGLFGQAQAPSAPPTMDSANLALDQAIKNLASSFHAAPAPAPIADPLLDLKGGGGRSGGVLGGQSYLDQMGGGGRSGGVLGDTY